MEGSRSRRRRLRVEEPEMEMEPEDQVNDTEGDVYVNFQDSDAVKLVARAAEITAPDVSPIFAALCIIVVVFHESHFTYTLIGIGIYLALQMVHQMLQEDFRNDLFWNIFSMVGNIVFYLFLGTVWALLKWYLVFRAGELPNQALLDACIAPGGEVGCFTPLLWENRLLISQWITSFPFSIARTIFKDPLRIAVELILSLSERNYMRLAQMALAARSGGTEAATWHDLVYYLVFFSCYFGAGFVWVHAKLFIDVWQGALPKKLDQEVRDVYHNNKSYWEFVRHIKWLVVWWLLVWPFSLVHTCLRHPFRILTNFLYRLSQGNLIKVTIKAMDWRAQEEKEE